MDGLHSRKKFSYSKLFVHTGLILFLVVSLAPLLIVVSSSLRTKANMKSPLILFNQFSLESYIDAFTRMGYLNSFLNSFLTTAGSVILVVLIASMASYPMGRIKSRTSKNLYYFFIAGLIIPAQMVIVPVAQMINRLNIPSTRFTPMIMFVTCSIPFSTFLYTGFMKGIPVEVEEAALIDGAGLFRRFWQIVFPLLKPATVSVIITQGIWIWNDYFFPMVFITKTAGNPLPLAMLSFLGDKENPTQWNTLFAACILCAIPLVLAFSLLQKHFISGVAAGAVKG